MGPTLIFNVLVMFLRVLKLWLNIRARLIIQPGVK